MSLHVKWILLSVNTRKHLNNQQELRTQNNESMISGLLQT